MNRKFENRIATIFGGTGFIGTQIVRELSSRGAIVKVATRIPERAYFLKPCGKVGQVVPMQCNYSDEKSIQEIIKGSDIVINCIGILYDKGGSRFNKAHIETPRAIAKACKKEGVDSFVHISALGIENGTSRYAKSKREGEEAVKKAYPDVSILRPSVVFGEGDSFFNMFARLLPLVPALPLIGGGKTRFQPVFVGDVADAVMAVLSDKNASGKIYQLGGPEIVNFKEIYERLFKYTGQKKSLISIPFWAAKLEACILKLFPKPLLTPDQVESLKTDTIVKDNALGFSTLGIVPTAMDLILPRYLSRFKKGGRFADRAPDRFPDATLHYETAVASVQNAKTRRTKGKG